MIVTELGPRIMMVCSNSASQWDFFVFLGHNATHEDADKIKSTYMAQASFAHISIPLACTYSKASIVEIVMIDTVE